MKAYTINTPTSKMPLYNVAHYHMFHGASKRLGSILPISLPYFSPLDGHYPLEITRSGSFIPPIFSTALTFVVSEEVKQRTEDLPGLKYLKVKFVKLINAHLEKGKFNYPRDCPVDNILERYPNDPQLFQHCGNYYEMVYPALSHILNKKPDDEDTSRLDLLSEDLLLKYPIMWDHDTIMSELAFERMESYFDHDFYSISEVNVPK